jgi:hypothetical protein
MVRRLRIAVSVLLLVACVALMGQWVRSHRWHDEIYVWFTNRYGCGISSMPGRIVCHAFLLRQPMIGLQRFTIRSTPNAELWMKQFLQTGPSSPLNYVTRWGFAIEPATMGGGPAGQDGYTFIVPYWFLVLASGSLAVIFWMPWPWRFNLRILFFVTTFVAIIATMSAWLDRSWIGETTESHPVANVGSTTPPPPIP